MKESSVQSSSGPGEKFLATVVLCAGLLRIAILFRLADGNLVQHIPDDAFYYLAPARNFAALGRWTFDGVEPSSGLHMLWGYLIALLFRIAPNATLHQVFAVAGVFQASCLALASYLVAVTGRRILKQNIVPGVAIVFLSAVCIEQAGWLMESVITILASSTVLWLLARERIHITPATAAGAVLIGFFLMMSRSDSGLLAFLFLVTLVILWKFGKVEASMPFVGALVLGGAVFGLLATVLHTHWVSGHWVQSSAQQKVFWTHVMPRSLPLVDTFFVIASFFNPLFNEKLFLEKAIGSHLAAKLVINLLRLVILVPIGWGLCSVIRLRRNTAAQGILFGLLAVLLCYSAFYSLDAAVQDWYVANLAAPAAILSGAAFAYLMQRSRILVYSFVALLCIPGFIFSLTPTFLWQEAMYRSGVYLHTHPEVDHAASLNAGIIGFFTHGNLTNLDGLINDSILPYAKSGTLAQYLVKRHIDYILESPQMFYAWMPLRGGYADGKIHRCITSTVDLFPDDPYNDYAGDRIRLYHLDMNCLAAK